MRRIYFLFLMIGLAGLMACGGATSSTPQATTPVAAPIATEDVRQSASIGPAVVDFASEESMQRLARAEFKVDFFKLSNHFEGQQNLGMCGPTSAVIVLNALHANRDEETKPTDPSLFPAEFAAGLPPGLKPVFHRYSQGIFFDDTRVSGVKKRETFYGKPGPDGKRDPGMQLRQLHDIFVAFGVKSQINVVDEKMPLEEIRQALRDNLGKSDDYVVVNYHRPVLQQRGGGHISPLGAYDQVSDSFLILDVNPNGKTWVWVQTEALVAAMRTFDTKENRGFLLVSEVTEADGSR